MNKNNYCQGAYGNCLYVKITEKCNANCSFCITQVERKCNNESAPREFIKSINLLSEYDKVMIQGGEPLLYDGLKEVISGIEKKRIYVTTNGSLLDTGNAGWLSQHVKGINISLHHYDLYKNQELTGIEVSFDRLKKAISLLLKAGVSVRIYSCLVRGYLDNLNDVTLMAAFVKMLGLDCLRIAELKHSKKDLFVDAREIFPDLPEEPYCSGCDQEQEINGIKIKIKMTCGKINSLKLKPKNLIDSIVNTKVIYPDNKISNGFDFNSMANTATTSIPIKKSRPYDISYVSDCPDRSINRSEC